MNAVGAFEILKTCPATQARRARLWTAHGPVDTPVFMPVGTQATVKGMSPRELEELDVRIILANAYHLAVRPGLDIVRACGGLHRFMGWDRPILTDSGGFQVFSLCALRKVRQDGVEFNSHVDGNRLFLGPLEVLRIQETLGSDIAMVFDECLPYPCAYDYACQAVDRTLAWASLYSSRRENRGQLAFGIVQGGAFEDLRRRCAEGLTAIGFDGYAIGGVSVGEPEDVLLAGVRNGVAGLPANRPRYLMGVGVMRQMVEAIALGVDMFDCVMPTRYARNGTAVTRSGHYPVKAGKYKADLGPVEEGCGCYACRTFTRAYVRHLLNVGEILGARLLTVHNLYRYMECMAEIRQALEEGRFEALRRAATAQPAAEEET